MVTYDAESGKRLWTLKLYDNRRFSDKEGDVQEVLFKSMTAQPDGGLLIENEQGKRFVVDPGARTSSVAVGQQVLDNKAHAFSRNGMSEEKMVDK